MWRGDEYSQAYLDKQSAAEAAHIEVARKGVNKFKTQSLNLAAGKLKSASGITQLGIGTGVEVERSGIKGITREEIDLLSSMMVNRIEDIGRRRAAPGRSQVLLSNRGL